MALIQKNGLLHYIDESGNVYVLYPITTLDNVSGKGKLLLSEDGKTLKTVDGTKINITPDDIGAGTFAGAVVAMRSGQTPGTFLLRNSKIVSAETAPEYNGEICWTYE